MRTKLSRVIIAGAMALSGLVAVSQQVAAVNTKVAKTQIKFSFKNERSSADTLLIIGPSGVIKVPVRGGVQKTITLGPSMQGTRTVRRDGREVKVPDGVFRVSLHFLDSDGKYLGPITFKTAAKQGSRNKWSTNVKPLPRGVTNLGVIDQIDATYGRGSVTLAANRYGRITSVTSLATGKPVGAGTLGLKIRSGMSSSRIHDFAVQCDETDQELGGDCDVDGVVNAIDPDDDDDGILDLADKSTSGFESQKYLPWSTLYLELGGSGDRKTLNANIGSVTKEDIELAIGADNGSFATNFYLNLPSDAADFDAAWIDCGDLSYCNAETGTATTGAPSGQVGSAFNNLWCAGHLNSGGGCELQILWRDYLGSLIRNANDPESDQNVRVSDDGDDIHNGLTLSENNGSMVWAGSMKPNVGELGTGVLEQFRVGDPYVLKLRNKETGAIQSIPMSLGAFFVTVPALKSANGELVNYAEEFPLGTEANPIPVGDDGTFTIEFWRPQRLAVAGVDYAADDVEGAMDYMDLGGLRYGLIMNTDVEYRRSALVGSRSGAEVGCTSAAANNIYVDLSANFARTPDTQGNPQWFMNLWPLTDRSTDGVTGSENVVSFTFNMVNCIEYLESRATAGYTDTSATLDISVTRKIPIQLTAVGIDLTGGASRAAQTFWVELPAVG